MRTALLLCFGLPLAVLTGAYGWMALDHGTLWLWDVIVHESGRYTLGQTVFYVNHFLREIPTVVAMALFVLAGYRNASPRPTADEAGVQKARLVAWSALGGALLLCALALGVAAQQNGLDEAVHDLFQFRTRDTLSEYGSHWHFHWLSTLWFGVAAFLGARPMAWLFGDDTLDKPTKASVLRWVPWIYVAVLTVVFGLSAKIFVDVRYAGHQAREIMTHGPITYLLAFGAVHSVARWFSGSAGATRAGPWPRFSGRTAWFQLGLFLIIPTHLAVVTLSNDFMAVGQSQLGLAAMVAAHYFEHFLDYLLAILLVVGGYAALVLSRRL